MSYSSLHMDWRASDTEFAHFQAQLEQLSDPKYLYGPTSKAGMMGCNELPIQAGPPLTLPPPLPSATLPVAEEQHRATTNDNEGSGHANAEGARSDEKKASASTVAGGPLPVKPAPAYSYDNYFAKLMLNDMEQMKAERSSLAAPPATLNTAPPTTAGGKEKAELGDGAREKAAAAEASGAETGIMPSLPPPPPTTQQQQEQEQQQQQQHSLRPQAPPYFGNAYHLAAAQQLLSSMVQTGNDGGGGNHPHGSLGALPNAAFNPYVTFPPAGQLMDPSATVVGGDLKTGMGAGGIYPSFPTPPAATVLSPTQQLFGSQGTAVKAPPLQQPAPVLPPHAHPIADFRNPGGAVGGAHGAVDHHHHHHHHHHPPNSNNNINNNKKYYMQQRNVYISGLPETFRPSAFRAMCDVFGRIASSKLCMEGENADRCKGYGFVLYQDVEAASTCIATLNGKMLQGKQLQVRRADLSAAPQPLDITAVAAGAPIQQPRVPVQTSDKSNSPGAITTSTNTPQPGPATGEGKAPNHTESSHHDLTPSSFQLSHLQQPPPPQPAVVQPNPPVAAVPSGGGGSEMEKPTLSANGSPMAADGAAHGTGGNSSTDLPADLARTVQEQARQLKEQQQMIQQLMQLQQQQQTLLASLGLGTLPQAQQQQPQLPFPPQAQQQQNVTPNSPTTKTLDRGEAGATTTTTDAAAPSLPFSLSGLPPTMPADNNSGNNPAVVSPPATSSAPLFLFAPNAMNLNALQQQQQQLMMSLYSPRPTTTPSLSPAGPVAYESSSGSSPKPPAM